jgi:phenylalanyl-tRNA synthetase beta chain
VRVRHAREGEPVTLLDGSQVGLEGGALVVADDAGVQAVAGVMGAAGSAVDEGTTDVFLEAAHFRPGAVAGRARKLGQHTDASHRFERGVDPEMPRRAMERATGLLLELAGGRAGPVTTAEHPGYLPSAEAIPFHPAACDARLGTALGADAMADIFRRLGLRVSEAGGERWQVVAPSFRFDLGLEADLVEEVARVHGYDRLPTASAAGEIPVRSVPEMALGDRLVKRLLTERGYQEVVTFSFVDPQRVARLAPDARPLALANPLSGEQSVMRVDLLPGLLETVARNQARQEQRLRLFEVGRVFPDDGEGVAERDALGGALAGPVDPPHWDGRRREQDFFDAKGDLEALLERAGLAVSFEPCEHPALHPGQAARMVHNGETVGWLGTLHPRHGEALEVSEGVVLFQLDLTALRGGGASLPRYEAVPRLPASHRDLAVVVDEGVAAGDLVAALPAEAGGLRLMDWHIFDLYTGQGVEPGTKSVGLALTLQAYEATPTDEQIEQAVRAVVNRLHEQVGARLRQ